MTKATLPLKRKQKKNENYENNHENFMRRTQLGPSDDVRTVVVARDDGIRQLFNLAEPVLSKRINDLLAAEYNWFERITKHALYVGIFYELLLAKHLKSILTINIGIGTGFVYDTSNCISSSQVDIILYDKSIMAPIFEDGGLVVVSPQQVIAAIEVKKMLRKADIKDVIFKNAFTYYGTSRRSAYSEVQAVFLFAFESYVKKESLIAALKDAYEEIFSWYRVSVEENDSERAGYLIAFVFNELRIFVMKETYWVEVRPICNDIGNLEIEITISTLDKNECAAEFFHEILLLISPEINETITSYSTILKPMNKNETIKTNIPFSTKFQVHEILEHYEVSLSELKRSLRLLEDDTPAELITRKIRRDRLPKEFREFVKMVNSHS